jgi:hypothetical protein
MQVDDAPAVPQDPQRPLLHTGAVAGHLLESGQGGGVMSIVGPASSIPMSAGLDISKGMAADASCGDDSHSRLTSLQ